MTKKKIGIIGATGYTGEELLKVLQRHPQVQVVCAADKEDGKALQNIFPYLSRYPDIVLCTAEQALQYDTDLIFLCLPHGTSGPWVKAFFDKGCKIIDLGADFRFTDTGVYKKWYHDDHPHPELLQQAVYGLPEWYRERIKKSSIIGNPGCYPTSVLLATLPPAHAGLLKDATILVDSKSGISGMGRTPSAATHYIQLNENFYPYKPGHTHRHIGEMEQELSQWAGTQATVVFTPHLLPLSRGILSSITVRVKDGVSKKDLLQCLTQKYATEPFVRVLQNELPAVKMTAHSNLCFIGVDVVQETDMALIFSAIDNLGKGASWQAIQNMNLVLGFPEDMGLI